MQRKQILYWTTIAYDSVINKEGYYVLGYTKSGTNWLCKLLSDYFELPLHEPWNDKWPSLKPHIFHLHRFLPMKNVKGRTIYMMRDGRDAVVSRYHTMVKQVTQRIEREEFTEIIGKKPTVEELSIYLPAWINYLSTNTRSTVDWKNHVEKGLTEYPHRIKFEDLKQNGIATFQSVVEMLSGEEADLDRISKIYEYYQFDKVKARKKGDSYTASFLRSGKAGGWKTVFNLKSAEAFAAYAGHTLIKAGYEKDDSWINEFKEHQ
jgi:hypothetical protein